MRAKAIRSILRGQAHDDSLPGLFEIDADGLGGDAQFEGRDLVAEVDLPPKERLGLRGDALRGRAVHAALNAPARARQTLRLVECDQVLGKRTAAWSNLRAALDDIIDTASAIEP